MRRRVVLIHLHCIRTLCGGLSMGCSLLTRSFRLLLLLDTWWDSLVQRSILQVHWWHEWSSELLLCDEGMQLGLLGRPALERVDGQQTTDEVNESNTVIDLYRYLLAAGKRRV